ncbi:MAG TPA: hypothetical protein VH306_03550 [Gaiellaceae bacterium]
MPTFDVHQHLWPEQFVAALARRDRSPRLRGSRLELAGEGSFEIDLAAHALERRLALLDRDGTDVAIVSLQPTLGIESLPREERGPLLDAWHEGVQELAAVADGRLRAFAAGACLDGFAGACVPASEIVRGSAELNELAGEVQRRGQALFVHPGPCTPPDRAPAWWSSVVDYTAQMQAAYAAWLHPVEAERARPATIFAILAGGGPIQLERLASRGIPERVAVDESVFLDVASYGRRALELCFATFGTRQLVYGSDIPVVDPEPTLRALRGFGDAVEDVIRSENPTLLFR